MINKIDFYNNLNILRNLIFSLVIFIIFFLRIRYSQDWDAYELMFDQYVNTDIFSLWIAQLCRTLGFGFVSFYQIHLSLAFLLYYVLISRFNRNVFIIYLCLLLINYVQFANQLRYFISFPLFVYASYLLFCKNNKKAYILLLISPIIHIGILSLYIFLPAYKIFQKFNTFKLVTYVLSGSVVFFLLLKYVMIYIPEKFWGYLEDDNISTLAGGVYNLIFPIVCIIIVIFSTYRWHSFFTEKQDKVYHFLRLMSYSPILFIIISIDVQVIAHRYIYPFLVVWILFVLYPLRYLSLHQKKLEIVKLICFMSVLLLLRYGLPILLFGSSVEIESAKEIFSSFAPLF